jgi:hypothetical protein
LRGERKQAAVRHLIETMAEGIVGAQRQAGELPGETRLQASVSAIGVGAELVDTAEPLVERLLVGIWRETSLADVLIAIQLYLVRLMDAAGADIIHPFRWERYSG